jgi:hypothetical protein
MFRHREEAIGKITVAHQQEAGPVMPVNICALRVRV